MSQGNAAGSSLSRRTFLGCSGAVAAGLITGDVSARQQDVVTPVPLGPAVPPEVRRYATDWPMAQRDLAATRAAPESAITSDTFTSLDLAWTFPIEAVTGYGGMTATPLIAGETVYVQDMRSNVFALDRTSGAVRWHQEYNVPSIGPNGLALGYGMIFGATGDTAEVFALDAATGREQWRIRLTNHPFEGIDMAPAVYDNTVFVSTIAGNTRGFNRGGTRGVLYALEAISGATLWSFETTTGNLWGNPRINSGGGLWYPPSFDEAGSIYFGVANAAPWAGVPDYPNGSSRPGENDYASSMVALDLATGAVRWAHNAAPHDLLDHDFQNSPVLLTVTIDGAAVDLAVGSGKTGTLIAVERSSGTVIWETAVGIHDPSPVPPLPDAPGETIAIMPGAWGGVVAPIAAVDGLLLVPVVDFATRYSSTGYDTRSMFDFSAASGQIVAVEAASGQIAWSETLPVPAFAGATVAGDLVLTGGPDGVVRAFVAANGREVGQVETSAGLNAPFAVAGDLLIVPAAGPRFGANAAANDTATTKSVNQIIAYHVNGYPGTPHAIS